MDWSDGMKIQKKIDNGDRINHFSVNLFTRFPYVYSVYTGMEYFLIITLLPMVCFSQDG